MDLYLISLYLFFYLILSWRRPDWALMLLLFLLPAYQIRFSVFGLPSTLLEGMILIGFAVWALKNYKQIFSNVRLRIKNFQFPISNFQFYRYPFDIEIILFLIISWVAIAVAGFSTAAFGVWKAYFFEPVLVYILLFNVFRKNNANLQINANTANSNNANKELGGLGGAIGKILWPLALSALAVSLVAILQKAGLVASPANFWPRVTGPFLYPNAVGLFVGPLIPLFLGFLYHYFAKLKKGQWRAFDYLIILTTALSILLSLSALILASSEGAAVGVMAAFFLMAVFYLARIVNKSFVFKLNYLLIGLIFTFCVFSSWFFLHIVPEHKYFNFESRALNYLPEKLMLKDFSGEVRKQQWRETFSLLKQDSNWLWGAGLSGYQAAVTPYHQEGIFFNQERDEEFRTKIVWFNEEYKAKHWRPVEIYMYPHNLVLNFWVELGLLGAVLFLWIVIKSIKYLVSGIKQGDNFALGLLGALVVILIHGLVDVPYFKNDLAVMFWALAALVGLARIKNQESAVNSRIK